MSATSQTDVDRLATYTWAVLSKIFQVRKLRRPPVYLYLSRESEHSLRSRNLDEREFVWSQQAKNGGATLRRKPAAWVSRLDQVPEETGHLFVLKLRRESADTTIESPVYWMQLHESFARLSQCLILGKRPRIRRSKDLSVWNRAHRLGYQLGDQLADRYFENRLKISLLRRCLKMNWQKRAAAGRALQTLRKL